MVDSSLSYLSSTSVGTSVEPLSRRGVLILGATGAAAAVGAGLVLWSQLHGTLLTPVPSASTPSEQPPASEATGTLREPDILSSTAGLLELTLSAAMTDVTIAGATVRALTYNGDPARPDAQGASR